MTARTVPTSHPTVLRAGEPAARPGPDALATPWSGVALRAPAPLPVDFSDVVTVAGPTRADQGTGLRTPWERETLSVRRVPSVDFSGLAAPGPLVVRGAFVPEPRDAA